MNVFQQTMKGLEKSSGLQIATALVLTLLIAAGLTIFVALAFSRHHPENLLLRYLVPLLLLVGSGVSLLLGSYSEDKYARIRYAFLVVFFLLGAGVSLVVTLILYAFFI
jgi:hypothetical protein